MMRSSALIVVFCCGLSAQAQSPQPRETLGFHQYLSAVAKANPTLAAQRATLPLAEAQVVLARVFPDPVVTVGLASLDVSNVGAQNNIGTSVSLPIEWPGKRSARVTFSESNLSVAAAEFEDAARTVRATAAIAYVDAVFAHRVLEQRRAAVESLRGVVALNEKRLKEGAGAEIVLLQSRVEERRAEGELATAEGEARALRLVLDEQMGRRAVGEGTFSDVDSALRLAPQVFDAQSLVTGALESRPDHRARTLAIEAAQAQLGLAKANRGPDITVGLGWLYYTPGAANSAYQGPGYHTVSALLSAPLPFSRIYDGEIKAAAAAQQQAQAQYSLTDLRVETEVRAALIRYDAARERLSQFDQALLADGDRLLQMARYSFEQGAGRLIELLSAQRSWADLHLAYENALAEHARALIALETAAGIWNLDS